MIKRIPEIFTRDFEHWFKIEIFRRVLYIFLFLNTISLLPAASEIWAYYGMAGTRWDYSQPIWRQLSTALTSVLSHPANAYLPWVYVVFIFGQLMFLATGILRILPRISAVAVYFFTINLNMKGSIMFTGGEVLVNLVLFYLMFIQRSDQGEQKWKPKWRIDRHENPKFTSIQNTLNNTFYIIILLQICVLYFFSTFYKLFDENWRSGEALMFISRVSEYSSAPMRWMFSENPLVSVIATYLALLYQGLFPVLVWVKSIKIPFLICGVLLHLCIAFGMGIFAFGVVMCLVYIPFLNADHLEKIRMWFRFKRAKKTI